MYYDLSLNLPLSRCFEKEKEHYEFELLNWNKIVIKEGNVVYNNDGSFNRVRISENIFANIYMKNLKSEMKKHIQNMLDKSFTLIESGQKVYIGKDLSGEYIFSKYAVSLTNTEIIIRGKLLSNLKDIVENCSCRNYSNHKKEKHKKDAKYGFYKYKIRFSIALKEREELYKAVVLIRNDANGKKYLYDILGIKKID